MNAAAIPFTRIPDAVLLDPRLTAVQFRIYAVIARRADRETASAFPSYATIAKDANVSRTSAIKGVAALVSLGYLSKQAQQSGQGDLTSNLYTISGEGSQLFAPRRQSATGEVVQQVDHGSATRVPPVVQNLDHGGANVEPRLESTNQKQSNKTQENRIAPTSTHETGAVAAAAADPGLKLLLTDFHENIGALTTVAMHELVQLAQEYSAGWVRDAIKEAVIYEKRSLAYVRRILRAWKRNGRASEWFTSTQANGSTANALLSFQPSPLPATGWPPPDLQDDLWTTPSNDEDPAATAWAAISRQLPQFGGFLRSVTPSSLIGDVLTVGVSDPRVYAVLTGAQRHSVDFAMRKVLGNEALLHFEKVE